MVARLPDITTLKREVSNDLAFGASEHAGGAVAVQDLVPPALSFGMRECSGLSLGDRMDSGLNSFLSFPLTPKACDMPANNDEHRDSSDDGEAFQGSEALASTSNYDMQAPRDQDNEPAPLITREISNSDFFLKRGVSGLLNESQTESSVHNVSDPIFFTGVAGKLELKKLEPVQAPQSRPQLAPVLQREPSRSSERIRTPTLKRKIEEAIPIQAPAPAPASGPTPSASDSARANKRPKTTKKVSATRGAHVKERPEMHERARAGQEHWGKIVQDVRTEWQRSRMWEKDPNYSQQISMCTRRHIKSQHECFLRVFQISKIENVIHECEFSQDEDNSFCGWVSFKVNKNTGRAFRERIANMFPGQSLGNTLNNAFRRAGIIPEANADETKPRSWEDAWNGVCAFKFHGDKRANYS
mmetsp:Transcript_13631/g.21282  ORF Transcript_13631/g.21282 Transcript_13631/m.21282 type:complete len:414 (-) Transcript_13631:153-1394(-)|eukprot:CAMPEP_0184308570 /NCGR_PEP_ID=MMETSP1049-20130417/16976_1 /TAXON_ID=77928 /ORGANISM="Proteomonas sulcata, Strain CCMP704" /LENGTH=413 /DNA_ID=CAMNT_0026621283 /DNA_START=348 /DNA_END=1589 /DNA_ORIENTATION=+